MNHDDLVKRAVRWLKSTRGCGVAVPELVAACVTESPDAIGWRDSGRVAIVVECKVSRSDFLSDFKKAHRHAIGLGQYRYYMTPKGLVKPGELLPGWGLLEVVGRQVRRIKEAERQEDVHPWGHEVLMYSLLRRVEVRGKLRQCLAPKWGGDFNDKPMRPMTGAEIGLSSG